MSTVVVTGAHGLVGFGSRRVVLRKKGHDVVGIDNDMRARFSARMLRLRGKVRAFIGLSEIRAVDADIRDISAIERVFGDYSSSSTW